jgi:polysaccharide export outer membrane protein
MLRRWLLLEKKGALMRTRWTAPVTLLAFLVVSNVWVKAQQSGAPVVADEYVLGVEDKLGISVWREAELGKSVVIRPDGTPRQLTEDLTKSIAKYIKEPVVTVVVEEINNFKVFVLGEVTVQGTLNLRRHTRLLEAIAMAGGVTQFADRSNVVLLRYQDGKEARTKIDYRKIVSGDKPELNVELKPGDTIIVN